VERIRIRVRWVEERFWSQRMHSVGGRLWTKGKNTSTKGTRGHSTQFNELINIIVRVSTVDHWTKSPFKKGTMLGLTVPAATGLYEVRGLYHHPYGHGMSLLGRNNYKSFQVLGYEYTQTFLRCKRDEMNQHVSDTRFIRETTSKASERTNLSNTSKSSFTRQNWKNKVHTKSFYETFYN
jgi:hypothetical protein